MVGQTDEHQRSVDLEEVSSGRGSSGELAQSDLTTDHRTEIFLNVRITISQAPIKEKSREGAKKTELVSQAGGATHGFLPFCCT